MKRLIVVLVVICLVASSIVSVYAEDLNTKSDEELIAMYREIQSILLDRNGKYTVQLNAGKYIIGDDLPAGSYRIEAKGAYSSSTLKVYEDANAKYPEDTYILAELYNSSVIGKLDLVEGNVLNITGSTLSIASYNAAQIELDAEISQPAGEEQPDAEAVDSLVVPPGKYQVGPEIPAGTYRIVCEEAYGMASFSVFESEKSVFPSYDTILSPLMGNAEIGKLELKKGSYVEVAEGTVTLHTYTGLGN